MSTSNVELAKKLAREAGELIALRREGSIEVANTKSSAVDIVTAVDRESEALLFDKIEQLRPEDGFLGEEGKVKESKSGLTWVIDPIDGTVNFFYDIPHYAVSVAVVSGPPVPGQWQVEAGAVINPATGEFFWAERGHGSFLGDRKLQISAPPPLDQSLVATGFAYASTMREEQGRLIHQLLPQIRDLRRMGTASLDFAFVAANRVDLVFERTLKPWDHAAGELIITEAGGVVEGMAGRPHGYEGIIAGHPKIVEEFSSLISKLGGDKLLSDILG